MSTTSRVVWDQEDKLKVASAVKVFLAGGGEISIVKFNELVKETMPKEKQRTIASWTSVLWLKELVGAIPNPGLIAKSPRKASPDLPENILDHPIDSVRLTEHIRACLHSSGINSVRDLVTKREEEILAIRQLGTKAVSLIKIGLLAKDSSLKLGMEIKEEVPEPEVVKPAVTQEPANMDSLADTLVYAMTPYLKELAATVVDKSINVFHGEVTKQLVMRTTLQDHERSAYPVDHGKVAKKKVVVVGMENREAARLDEEFGKVFTLRVYNHTKSLDTLRNSLPSADHVIVATDNCNHSATDVIKSRYFGQPTLVTGGLTKVRQALRDLVQNSQR